MKVFVIFFVLIGLVGLVYADEKPPVPEPTPTCPEGTVLKGNNSCIESESICGEGTTYQDGICVVDKIKNSTKTSTDPSTRWGAPYTFDIDSPLKQLKSGIPSDEIQCNDGLVLIKKHDNSPACVKPDSVIELIKRNWLVTEEVHGYAIDYGGEVKHLPFADICTNEMRVILLTYSNIASSEEHFVMDDVMLPSGMNQEDFERCAHETEFTKSRWNMVSMENPKPSPEPEPMGIELQNLIDARNKLREAYHANVSWGSFNIKDAIVGYGIGDGLLVVDILEKYYNKDRKLIEQKIIDIIGADVDIEFNPSDAIIPTRIESVFPYIWNGFLHRSGIDFTPKEQSYANNDMGYDEVHRVCSPIIATNGTELYVSSVFVYEPFEITETHIDKIQPDDCYKIWKTDTILVEPDLELGLWLENYWKNEK